MLRKEVQVERPDRWDIPLDDQLTPSIVDRMMQIPPFSRMDPDRFPESCPLRGILQNDTRVVSCKPGDLIIREGDYGNSAFMLLTGNVVVTLDSLPAELLGRPARQRLRSLWKLLRHFRRPRFAEVRRVITELPSRLGQRQVGDATRLFLQDVPGILSRHRTLQIRPGEIFGEIAALSRSQRSASVFATQPSQLLEIRWQGLRDLMKYDSRLRDHIDQLYRQNSLATHLRQTSLFSGLDKAQLKRVVDATQFETYGNFEWNRPYQQLQQASIHDRIGAEPVIALEGNSPNGLLLIRNGFARCSVQYGHSHRTVSYLGKGQLYGLEELFHQWQTGHATPLRHSLRAVGYVDVLRIPADQVESLVFNKLPAAEKSRLQKVTATWHDERRSEAPTPTCDSSSSTDSVPLSDVNSNSTELPTSMLEFLVDQRLMNGTQTMVIHLDRCTRCDDCVRACSDTHDNNPRFVRDGMVFHRQMFASACMHCMDPVCMIGCPTGAIARDEHSGAIVIQDTTCIGCSTCANSCPYQAIRMVPIRDGRGQLIVDQSVQAPLLKATKCDLCSDLLGGPACQRACPHDALVRIDLSRPEPLAQWLAR